MCYKILVSYTYGQAASSQWIQEHMLHEYKIKRFTHKSH